MKTILLDADYVAVRAALYCETTFDFGDGEFKEYHPEELEPYIDEHIESLMRTLKADDIICCLSSYPNFREELLPDYKGVRPPKPKLTDDAKAYIENNYQTKMKAGLEGDDVMGILMTHPKLIGGKKVIVSIDKDMQTIPGWLFNPDKDTKPRKITKEFARNYWIRQTLTGDTVDHYAGCPGVGDTTVDALFESPWKWVSYEHEFKRGPRAGQTETRWKKEPVDAITWDVVVSFFLKAGQTEEDAQRMARVSRILHSSDYDFKTSKVKLIDTIE